MKLVVAIALLGMVAIAAAVESKPAYGYDKGGYKDGGYKGGYKDGGYKGGYKDGGYGYDKGGEGYDQYGSSDDYGYKGYDNSAYDGYGYDKHGCRCKVECKDVPIQKCNVTIITTNKCTNVTTDVDILDCSTVCKTPDDYKSYKYDTKAEPAATNDAKPAYSKDSYGGEYEGDYYGGGYYAGGCKEVCKPAKKPVVIGTKCEDVSTKKYECGETITNKKCTKDCICGEKHYDDYGYAKQN